MNEKNSIIRGSLSYYNRNEYNLFTRIINSRILAEKIGDLYCVLMFVKKYKKNNYE